MKNFTKLFCLLSAFLLPLMAGCQQDVNAPAASQQPGSENVTSVAKISGEKFEEKISFRTFRELQEAKRATAKYRDIKKAIADGYADINVFIHHMGYHYMKSKYLDAKFEPARPELLVYSPNPRNGKMRLVALEYAVPQSLSPNAPEGFSGNADVWDKNDDFGLWTLHAWVWYKNPDGVFTEYNPLIP